MRVAFQGERGAYSEAAAVAHFGENIQPVPRAEFEQVFEAVSGDACERGIVPIENSLAGSIHRNYDLLVRHQLHTVGEQVLRVRHCLVAHPGVALDQVRTVMSHPQALAQCEHTLKRLGVSREATYDTAGAVKLLKESGDRHRAAIASRRAAQVYDMNVLAEGIEDDEANYTRFLVLAREPVVPAGPAKTSIVFSMKNVPGALFKALSVFALRDIDLTKIESRPIPGQTWQYVFYVDFVGSTADDNVQRALTHLQEITTFFRLFGSYERNREQPTDGGA